MRATSFATITAAFLIACAGDISSPTSRIQRPAFAVLIGQPITAQVRTEVAITLRITDSSDRPIPHQLVNFVVSDDGQLYAAASTTTDSGIVSARWTLGTHAGGQTIEARAVDPVTAAPLMLGRVIAIATPGPATSIMSSSDAVMFIGERRTVGAIFGLSDQYGNTTTVQGGLGLKTPWKVDGDTITAPDSATAIATAAVPFSGKMLAVRLFTTPDLKKRPLRMVGGCAAKDVDSLTFTAKVDGIAYSADRRSVSFVASYTPTAWKSATGTAGVVVYNALSGSLKPDTIVMQNGGGTFVVKSVSPLVLTTSTASTIPIGCKAAPGWRIVEG